MYLTIQGVVLRITDYKDRDALLTLLTQKHGKLTVKVRGLRSKKSPMIAACQLLTYSEFVIFEYRGFYTVNEAHPIEIFDSLRRDLQKLALATYFAQVAELISQEDSPSPELLALVLNSFHGLSKLSLPEEQIKTVFEFRSMCIAGFAPDVSGCAICDFEHPDLFDLNAGTFLCRQHEITTEGIRMPVTPSVMDAMRFLAFCEPKRIYSFSLPPEDMHLLANLTEGYLACQLSQGFSALDYYKSLLFLNPF